MVSSRSGRVSESRPRVGPRTYLLGGIGALSTFDPSLATIVGAVGGAAILLFSNLARFKVTAPVASMFFLVVWTSLSGLWSVNPYSVNVTITWVAVGLLFISGLHLVQTREQLRAVAIGYLLGSFLAVVRLLIENPGDLTGSASTRVTTVFEDVNVNYVAYALATGFALVVLLWNSATRLTLRSRVGLIATALAIVIGIVLTETRGALIGVVCAAIWIVLWRLFRIRTLVPITLALIIATIVVVSGVADLASLQFETGDRATGTWSGRLPLWDSARTLWAEHPIVGVGASGFAYASGYLIAAHNVILDLAVGVGIIGVILYVWVLRSALWTGTRTMPGSNRALMIGTFIAVSAPIYLTGAWVTAPAAWVALVLFARVTVLTTSTSSKDDLRGEGTTEAQYSGR
ncbi:MULTISPECIES: O-antigen ligase family protein [unclassified Microbacterium]|uniref:O-antigen ligase family protein n=1 Tax=unclassified Microbacterium TaxID=2609290 RepID=UPI00109C6CE9|nr:MULTISPECIES: O-antigen ligase family protein [unclassified Microbacterium]